MGPAAAGATMDRDNETDVSVTKVTEKRRGASRGGKTARASAPAGRALVVVESPTKVKTIQKYLDSKYIVKASMGHVRDLPKSSLGVDPRRNFKPKYVISPTKKKVLDDLKRAAEKSDVLYVATDPDREGEAIGWHLAQELGVDKRHVYRVAFNEITERAVRAAFQHPGKIDQKKVDAQQARRVLDRLVGYSLSPLLWDKLRRGLSAGRVQSVAVRLIVDREREIGSFRPEEYWSLHARLEASGRPERPRAEFVATLREIDGEKPSLPDEATTQAIVHALDGAHWTVRSVSRGERRRFPPPPFITSTLQQEAARKLGFTARKTMSVAQQLYEGIELGREGQVGLITYMRTDSVRIAREAQQDARKLVAKRYGASYVPETPPVYKSRGSAQEAHEAVRPSDVRREPKSLTRYLTRDQQALYRLIWERFVASQMTPAVYDTVSADIKATPARTDGGPGPGECVFRAQGATLRFNGFMAVYVEGREDAPVGREDAPVDDEEAGAQVPALDEGELLRLLGLDPRQHFTQPPPRYTEASLIKVLEELGIGRPSTYASILGTIINDRGYVHRERRTLFPTQLGIEVTDKLLPFFPEIMDVEFTAQMEDHLDKVEEGERNWVETVREFYDPFTTDLKRAHAEMVDHKVGVDTGEVCPECGSPLLERWGRFGKFMACSTYPECRYTKDLSGRERPEDQPTDETCPECGKPMVIKHGRFGRFIACSGYPECKITKPVTLGIACLMPGCSGELTERRSKRGRVFYGCSAYPACRFAVWNRPIAEPCPKCQAPFITERVARGRLVRACAREGCDFKVEIEPQPEPAAV
ncbi:MAG: type I DNA topoisomerase [Candidatus Rokubacteria bacterium]|nr:type I DNA topoisomerase [Candidatus Rokubacteria bacterium]